MQLHMNELEQKILDLEQISNALEPGEKERDLFFDQTKKFAHDFINSLTTKKAYNQAEIDVDA